MSNFAAPLLFAGAAGLSAGAAYNNMKAALSENALQARVTRETAAMNARMAESQAAMQAASVIHRANYDAQVSELNAQIARNNAVMLERSASQAREKASYESERIDRLNRKLRATQRARFAASGVSLEGTAADVMFDSVLQGELDELAAIYIGDEEARSSYIAANNQMFSATMADHQAEAIRTSGRYEADIAMWQGSTRAAIIRAEGTGRANLLDANSSMIRSQGYVNMFGSILTGAAGAYSTWPSGGNTSTTSQFISHGTSARSRMGIGRHT